MVLGSSLVVVDVDVSQLGDLFQGGLLAVIDEVFGVLSWDKSGQERDYLGLFSRQVEEWEVLGDFVVLDSCGLLLFVKLFDGELVLHKFIEEWLLVEGEVFHDHVYSGAGFTSSFNELFKDRSLQLNDRRFRVRFSEENNSVILDFSESFQDIEVLVLSG